MKEKILAVVVTAMLTIALPQPVKAVSCPMCPPSSQLTSKELDKLWDSWVISLSDSYGRTLDLLESNKPKEAAKEFCNGFVKTAKKLYSEAAENYPARFSKGHARRSGKERRQKPPFVPKNQPCWKPTKKK